MKVESKPVSKTKKNDAEVKSVTQQFDEELCTKRVENARKTLAKVINLLEGTTDELKWACDDANWNDAVVLQIEEAVTKLGYSLATLTNWNDALEEN